jgi:Methyl-accepting chemotaxis protein-like, first PDC sensor domain
MLKRNLLPLRVAATAVLILALSSVASAKDDSRAECMVTLEDAMIRLAAERIDDVFGAVAASTRALGDTYARLAAAKGSQTPPDARRWLALRTTQGHTTGLQSWPGDLKTAPAYQAPYPGFYSYNGEALSNAVLRQLDLFDRLVPTFHTVYESFPFSWVYMTTVDNAMMIYPYLPMDQAVNNGTPTETPYYRAADFGSRAVGWTPPYLDLVGAGMMITASYPVYDGESLLGVMSHDITLKELASSVLLHLTDVERSSALIVDGNGLAIDTTDPELDAEIDRVNSKAGDAVLYYRTAGGIETLGIRDALASSATRVNTLVEQVLEKARSGGNTVRFDLDGQHVLAARIKRTGWFVVLIRFVSVT